MAATSWYSERILPTIVGYLARLLASEHLNIGNSLRKVAAAVLGPMLRSNGRRSAVARGPSGPAVEVRKSDSSSSTEPDVKYGTETLAHDHTELF